MDNKFVLAIDYGTQSVRISVIDKKGKFHAFEQEKYTSPYFSIKPGYAEQDPYFYYKCLCAASKRLIEKNKELVDKCMSISSTCFRDSVVFLDNNMKPTRNCIIWLDQRQANLDRKIPWIYNVAFFIAGMKNAIKLNRKRTPALWVQENEPEIWAKTRYYVPLNLFLNYLLIGELADSASNMIGHFPINFKTGKNYSNKAMKGCIFGVDKSMLPRSREVGEVIGYITEDCHKETGLPIGLKYITTGYDKSCEALGCGATKDTTAHISYGTASSIAVVRKKYFEPEPFLPSYKTCYKGFYSGEVQVYRGYWMLKWFTEQFAEKQEIEAHIENMAVEEVLNQKILDIEPGCNGLVLQPYWGPGLRRPLAKGCVIGFYDVHSKFHMYKAIIEGIGFALREGLEGIEHRIHKKINKITVSGGGSKSDAICQITADIFGVDVYKNFTYECSSLGVAMSQFISLNEFNDIDECVENMVKYIKVFHPNKENHRKYNVIYKKVYKKMYPKLNSIYKNIHEIDKH